MIGEKKLKLPSLLGYDPKEIFNMDETGYFFGQSENKTLFEKGEKCSGGKKVKLQMTVSLCSSVLGEKVKPLVIWRYANPHGFKGIKKKSIICRVLFKQKGLDDIRSIWNLVEEIKP